VGAVAARRRVAAVLAWVGAGSPQELFANWAG
jgi:hypothetical protein